MLGKQVRALIACYYVLGGTPFMLTATAESELLIQKTPPTWSSCDSSLSHAPWALLSQNCIIRNATQRKEKTSLSSIGGEP